MNGPELLLDPGAGDAPAADWRSSGEHEHFVQFYEQDAFLVASVAEYMGDGFTRGAAGIVIATRAHREAIEKLLHARGIDVAAARERGQYVAVDAADALSQFMRHGWPNDALFMEVIGRIVAEARRAFPLVRAFGEMVALLWAEGNLAAALHLEELWNRLAQHHSFALFCAYPMSGFGKSGHGELVNEICHAHSHVLPAERYAALTTPQERLREITELQHKAKALDTAVVERAAAERALSRRELELAEANRRKDEFLAMLSHELRNPLSAVGTALRLMHQAGDDPQTTGRVREIIDRQVQRMTRLVDDLLDVSRISHGKMQLHEQMVSIAGLTEHAVEMVRPLVQERGHHLAVEIAEPLTLLGDAVRLEQLLVNLLHNAAKYTEPGGRIVLGVRREGADALISVRDNGIGIAPEMCERIFDSFVQGRPATAHGGLGIGLTLARAIAQLHGGNIEARSEGVGFGAELIVRLPIRALPAGMRNVNTTARTRGAAPPHRRFLVVDDNIDAADALAEYLRGAGHHVQVAHGGSAALQAAVRMRPEIVILDIGMPDLDGYEVARRLRTEVGLASSLLVALTGFGYDRDRQRADDAGFDHYFVKPVDLEQLEHRVAAWHCPQAAQHAAP